MRAVLLASARRRAPASRSGDALDCRRQSGAEERGFAESDGVLRDAMARGAQELRRSCRPVWPVDRPCARPKATPWHRAPMDSSVSPTHGEQERLERTLRLPVPAACRVGVLSRRYNTSLAHRVKSRDSTVTAG